MNTRSRFLMLPVVLLVIACTRSPRASRDSISDAPSSDRRSDSVVIDGVEYDRLELEFMDRSSQGGVIEVNLINNEPALFEVTLFAERGKRTLRVDLRKENQIEFTDQLIGYDRSIYEEGEVEIESQVRNRLRPRGRPVCTEVRIVSRSSAIRIGYCRCTATHGMSSGDRSSERADALKECCRSVTARACSLGRRIPRSGFK